MFPQLSAIDMTGKKFFERLYLVLGLQKKNSLSQMSLCTHNSDYLSYNYFSIFMQFFSPNGPSFFGHHHSPSNLAESRYPPRKSKRDIKHVMPSVCVSTTLRGILRKHNLIKVADMPCAGCECVVEVVAYKGVVRVKG